MEATKPFLRWAGGKRWLAALLYDLLAPRLAEGGRYYEPFLGSGAMFFRLAPPRALLSDLNPDLINAFRMVSLRPLEIARRLGLLPSNRATYDAIRSATPSDPVDQAVRFVYLNRNCWGGLYRENRYGYFNTPWGGGERHHLGLARDGTLERVAESLRQDGIELQASDFEASVDRAGNGDVVYCDPTYRPRTRRQFDRYGKTIFDWGDQERLAAAVWRAFKRGSMVLVSNTSCLGVCELYHGAGLVKVDRRKGLAPNKSETSDTEYLFILDPVHRWVNWSRVGTVIRRQFPELGETESDSISAIDS